ncbi:OmpA family protein [Neisseria dumasiana]|uniref:OmpA-like domain-containing protein n=1 Tax=Neisseria dumasiana TaxID=1931275 RepID=A0ABX3WQH3_9NEIS|nr:OmpA family protein [Neisseria dumasiana]OSI36507.1 hypothetical protein BV913_01975 [Neisseria dumasiana]UOO84046.1 OmpA family protein [Neisseria dumasiana]
MKVKTMFQVGASLMMAAALSACASKSHVKRDGTTDNPVFPAVEKVSPSFKHNKGTFPTADELAQIKPGMTKDQFYKLLGRPHFNEGMFGVREWDYVFHFHTPGQGTDNVSTCQFKILYDAQKYARSFHWKAVDPEHAVCPPQGSGKGKPARYTLSADALFAFDKSGLEDIQAEGRGQLDKLVGKLKKVDLRTVRVVGHTDYLGSDSYNLALSARRAETVRQYLINSGIAAKAVHAYGAGETEPVKQCADNGGQEALISCLQPNRRVEIEVEGTFAS